MWFDAGQFLPSAAARRGEPGNLRPRLGSAAGRNAAPGVKFPSAHLELLVSQRHHGIDLGCSTGRDEASDEGGGGKDGGGQAQNHRVVALDAVEFTGEQATASESCG